MAYAPATHKVIGYYSVPMGQPGGWGPVDPASWELYDLVADPLEKRSTGSTIWHAASQGTSCRPS